MHINPCSPYFSTNNLTTDVEDLYICNSIEEVLFRGEKSFYKYLSVFIS